MVAILSSTLKRASFPVDKHKKTVLLFAIVALGFSFSVLFAVLGPLGRVAGSIDAGPVPGSYDAQIPSACHTLDQYNPCDARGLEVSPGSLRQD